jgi:hypothetical protein
MPPITAVPIAMRLLAPGAGRQGQRQHAEDEGEAGHQDRAQADARGLERGLDHALALLLRLFGELDHQDRVLGRQSHGGEQSDLEERRSPARAGSPRRSRRPGRAARPAAPRSGSSSSRTARRGTGRRRAARARRGSAPGPTTGVPDRRARPRRRWCPGPAPPAPPYGPSPRPSYARRLPGPGIRTRGRPGSATMSSARSTSSCCEKAEKGAICPLLPRTNHSLIVSGAARYCASPWT